MAITLADFNKIWASTSPLTPYSFSESNYKQGWNFIGSTPPARQMWDFLQKNNDEKMQYLANNYLPLSGGTMTGDISNSANARSIIYKSINNQAFVIFGGNSFNNGASLYVHGKDSSDNEGIFSLTAHDGTNNRQLIGRPNGTLTWGGNNVITSDGGAISGLITFNQYNAIRRNVDNAGIYIGGATESANGAELQLYGKDISGNTGRFFLFAKDGTNSPALVGRPDGTLTWNGQSIQTSSDKRLKTDFADVPADVLEAWGKVEWKQFKYIDDAERKGVNNCRWHTGLVAQDVKEVGEENHVDLLKYGILCHDVREAVEEEKDENGNIIKEASEAVDLWTVRYEEALAMEVIYLRNEIKKLREEIKALRTE